MENDAHAADPEDLQHPICAQPTQFARLLRRPKEVGGFGRGGRVRHGIGGILLGWWRGDDGGLAGVASGHGRRARHQLPTARTWDPLVWCWMIDFQSLATVRASESEH